MENLKEETQVHPADVLAKALERASGLLGVLSQLYDADREVFSGGNSFVVHALATSSALVGEAKDALSDLHYSCDLTLLNNSADTETVIEMSFADRAPMESQLDDFVSVGTVETQTEDLAPQQEEQVAQTYLELLRKLTAAEVFAAEQQALSVPGSSPQLLPLLQSLREDLEKIHTAA